MSWEIKFYDDNVMKAILNWPIGMKSKFTHISELLKIHGPLETRMPFVKPMGRGLFEIRATGKEGAGRAFFCMLIAKQIMILHSFIKKTQQTPIKELEIARRRMKEVI